MEVYTSIVPGGLLGNFTSRLLNKVFITEHSIIFLFMAFWALVILIFRFSLLAPFYFCVTTLKAIRVPRVFDKIFQSYDNRAYCSSLDVQKECSKAKPQSKLLMPVLSSLNGMLTSVVNGISNTRQTTDSSIYEDPFWSGYIQPAIEIKPQEKLEPKVAIVNVGVDPESYILPKITLNPNEKDTNTNYKMEKIASEGARLLEEKLACFSIHGKIINVICGPAVTLFEYQPVADTRVSNVIAREDDLALALQAMSLRIIAPIPGRDVIGFEVAWAERTPVLLRMLLTSEQLHKQKLDLPMILGKDSLGKLSIINLAQMPHLLVAGSTGSGKSVGLNGMLITLLCTKKPDEVKLILIDPKRLEFSLYADIAHLMFPIINDPQKAILALKNAINIMQDRYELMAKFQVRNIVEYNALDVEKLPFIVIVIDELADLMMTAGKEIENLITRLAQMARAAGIHMIVATQRPSVDVITGLIKVNFPSRISFKVTTKVDSRTILDCVGAEKLLGKGDMLFLNTQGFLSRIHGAYVSDKEINEVVAQIKSQREVVYNSFEQSKDNQPTSNEDNLYSSIVDFVHTKQEISISLVQRIFKIGYNRSARLIDQLEVDGHIMPSSGSKMRKVIKDL